MTNEASRVLDRVRESLGAERMAEVAAYLRRDLILRGQRVQVGDAAIDVPWDAYLVFVDLKPGANWGHECCYLAIRRDGDEVIRVAAHMPPFLKSDTSDFHPLWRGPRVPPWAIEPDAD